VFAASIDNGAVWHRWQREPGGDWSRWRSLDRKGHGFAEVAAAANIAGCLVLLATEQNTSQGLWQRKQTTPGGDWSPWDSLSDLLAFDVVLPAHGPIADPTLARDKDQRLQLGLRISGIGETYFVKQAAADPASLHSWAGVFNSEPI